MHRRIEKIQRKLIIRTSQMQNEIDQSELHFTKLPQNPDVLLSEHEKITAKDMDILGEFSLLRLINNTISSKGFQILAQWCLQPTTKSEIIRRQISVQHLEKKIVFCHRFLYCAKESGLNKIEFEKIPIFLEKQSCSKNTSLIFRILFFFSVTSVLGFAFCYFFSFYSSIPLLIWIVYITAFFFLRNKVSESLDLAVDIQHILKALLPMLTVIEKHKDSKNTPLHSLFSLFQENHLRPSLYNSKLNWIIAAFSIRTHPLIYYIIHSVFPWDFYFALKLEKQRKKLSPLLKQWIQALHEFDALISLAVFAHIHPAWPYAQFFRDNDHRILEVTQLAHPLLAVSERVANDFSIDQHKKIILITGSNMSGKSTFLRTIGISLILAKLGTKVCAQSFFWKYLEPYSCMRITDQLETHVSYFYAEVLRLYDLLNAAKNFVHTDAILLIDEIFKGTNNRERYIGAKSYIESLSQTSAYAIITTHDLDLTELEQVYPSLSNSHFEETFQNNTLIFDYRIKPGPCKSTNALFIMSSIGLPILTINEKNKN